MLQRLPIALAKVKAGDTPENLLNEIREIREFSVSTKIIYQKCISQFNECNKGTIQKWILYLWILKIVKHLIVKH